MDTKPPCEPAINSRGISLYVCPIRVNYWILVQHLENAGLSYRKIKKSPCFNEGHRVVLQTHAWPNELDYLDYPYHEEENPGYLRALLLSLVRTLCVLFFVKQNPSQRTENWAIWGFLRGA